MCVAYPGRVETIEGAHGLVNFSGNKVRVNLSMVSVETGDYVLGPCRHGDTESGKERSS